jgi:acyl-CoA synthetase (AMP-forming)/AMP-acid ligase II
VDPTSFGELTWRAARLFPDRAAIVQGDVELNHGELDGRIRRAAALVRSLGVRPREPVLLLLPNDWRFAEALLGTIRAGGVATPLNTRLGADTLAYVAGHSEARVLLAHSSLREAAEALGVETTLYVDGPAWPGDAADDRVEPVESADPAMLMYTSGSTGRP